MEGGDPDGNQGLRPQQSTSLDTEEDDVPPDEAHAPRVLRNASDIHPSIRPPARPKWSGYRVTTTRHLRYVKDLVFSERINVLLIFVPVGMIVGFADLDPGAVFTLNALGIVPLAVVISAATESLASRLGDTFGALLNVTVGNTAELMIFFAALGKNQIRIVQASLLGSILANLLLVLGTAFLCGGLRFKKRLDDKVAGRMSIGLLDMGLTVSMLPVAMFAFIEGQNERASAGVLTLSRGISIGLIIVYIIYLFLQMRFQTRAEQQDIQKDGHSYIPLEEVQPGPSVRDFAFPRAKGSGNLDRRPDRLASPDADLTTAANGFARGSSGGQQMSLHGEESTHLLSPPRSPSSISSRSETISATRSSIDESVTHESRSSYDSDFADTPLRLQDNDKPLELGEVLHSETTHFIKKHNTPVPVAIFVLLLATGFVSVSTELAVDAIPAIVESWRISELFLGFIVLPIVGNAAEHVAATKLAIRNKMVLAKSVAIESSTQVVLFITPAIVLLGWFRERDMSLQFDFFEIACIATTALIVSVVVCYGRGDYKQGGLLLTIYFIFAFASVFYRGDVTRKRQ